jgi:hypothetical protein
MTFENRQKLSLIIGRLRVPAGCCSRDSRPVLQESYAIGSGLVNKTA